MLIDYRGDHCSEDGGHCCDGGCDGSVVMVLVVMVLVGGHGVGVDGVGCGQKGAQGHCAQQRRHRCRRQSECYQLDCSFMFGVGRRAGASSRVCVFIDEPKSDWLFPANDDVRQSANQFCPDLVGGVDIRSFANAIGP